MVSISMFNESIFLSGDIYLNNMFDQINLDFSMDFYNYLFELVSKTQSFGQKAIVFHTNA